MKICSSHLTEAKWVPAGVSRQTGKPYPGFYSCPEKEGNRYCNAEVVDTEDEIPIEEPQAEDKIEEAVKKAQPEVKESVWDLKDRQSIAQTAAKVAGELVAAEIAINKPQAVVDSMDRWEKYMEKIYTKIKHYRDQDIPF